MTSPPDLPKDLPRAPKPRWTFGAVALFVLGMLILVPSGLCTGVVGILSLFDSSSGFGEFLAIVLPFAGPPMAIGAALVYAGLKLRRPD